MEAWRIDAKKWRDLLTTRSKGFEKIYTEQKKTKEQLTREIQTLKAARVPPIREVEKRTSSSDAVNDTSQKLAAAEEKIKELTSQLSSFEEKYAALETKNKHLEGFLDRINELTVTLDAYKVRHSQIQEENHLLKEKHKRMALVASELKEALATLQ